MGLGRRFVGRAAELEVLRRELGRARSRDVRLVLVSGEPGIGKSRLVGEFADEASRDAQLLLTHCLELSGQAVPMAPIQDLVHRAYRRLGPTRLREAAGVYAADLALLEPALASEGPAPASQPEGSSRRQLDAVRHLLEQLGDSEPVLVVVEDLHWADAATIDALRFLATSVEGACVLVVATLRSGTTTHRRLRADVAGMPSVTWVDLGRLRPDETALLADAVRPEHPDVGHRTGAGSGLGADRVAHAVRASQGNPLYLQELLSTSDVDELPPSLQSLLLSRLSTLSDAARDVVDLVSVGDPPLRYSDLLRASDLSEHALDEAVADGASREVLTTDHADHVSLRHPLLGDAARADMNIGRRRDRHRAWAVALSTRPPTPRTALRIAYHWQQADDADRAVGAALDGARVADAVGDHVTRAALLDRVISLWPDAGSAVAGLDLVGVLQHAARAHELAGDYSAAAAALEQAIERSAGGDDPSLVASMLAARGRVAFWQDDSMLPFLQRALDVLPADGHDHVRAQVLAELCDALNEVGQVASADDVANEAARLAHKSGNDGAAALALAVLASVTQHEDPQQAVAFAGSAIELAASAGAGDVMLQAMATRLLTRGALLGAGPESMLDEIGHDLSLAHAHGLDNHRLAAWLRVTRAYTYLEMGDLDAALEAAERALPALRTHGAQNHCRSICATIHLIRGELDAAHAELEACVGSHYEHFETAAADPKAWMVWLDDGPEAAAELLLPHLQDLATHRRTALVTVPEQLFSLCRYLRLSGRADDPDDPGVLLLDQARSFLRPIISHDPLLDVIDATLAHVDRADPVPRWRSAAAKGPSWAAGVYWYVETLVRLAEGTDHRAEALQALDTAQNEARRLGSRAQLDEISAVRRRLDRRGGPAGLTAREVEVLELVARGLSNTEIGRRLHISRSTVGVHISNVLAKTGTPDRARAAAWGLHTGLLVSAGGPPASR